MGAVTAKGRECPDCGQMVRVKKDGELYSHPRCSGEDTPKGLAVEKGPWFEAAYDGECSKGDCGILMGEEIRTDGLGGYECRDCGDFDDGMDAHVRQSLGIGSCRACKEPLTEDDRIRADGTGGYECGACGDSPAIVDAPAETVTPTDAFDSPAPVSDPFDSPAPVEEEDELNVSGQPKARYEWRGEQNLGYLVKDPELGDFRRYKNRNPKGLTRATTFNKAASSTTAITDWKLRNVIVGASMRSDILLKAHGVDKEDPAGKRILNRLAAELEAVAGAKVGADIGTYLHWFTELMDAGLKTWKDAPSRYQEQLRLYAAALTTHGFEPVPGMIERTTMIKEFGGVVGTFDRILYHRPSNTYMIADLKTGKTMDYARDETFCQEWIYAHGVNQSGVYDWNTDTWRPVAHDAGVPNTMPPLTQVSETVGLIIHMPVQGKDAGSLFLEKADLVKGARYAQLCHDVRSNTKPKRELWSWTPPAFKPLSELASTELINRTESVVWEHLFAAVRSGEEASALWLRAKESGLKGIVLNDLVAIAREALAGKG